MLHLGCRGFAGSSPVFPTVYCVAKKRECKYAVNITVQLDKDFDKAEGVKEYTMCCAPRGRFHFGSPCIYDDNETEE